MQVIMKFSDDDLNFNYPIHAQAVEMYFALKGINDLVRQWDKYSKDSDEFSASFVREQINSIITDNNVNINIE